MRHAVIMGLLATLAFSGCKEEVSSTQAEKGKTEYVFGIIAKANNNPVFQAARKGAQDAAEELGKKHGLKIKIDWRTPDEEDAQKQANNIELLTVARVDGIGISCSDAKRVTKAIDAAVDAGIPVMCWDSDAPASKRFCYHGIDDFDCGRRVMTELGKVMGGKGVVAVLAGSENAPNLQNRARGVYEAAKQFPEITIKGKYYHDEDPQKAASRVEEVQTANPDIQGWVMIGGWALFSDAILKNPRFAEGKVKIVSVDAMPQCLEYLRKGVAQKLLGQHNYGWGYRAVEILLDKAAFGKEPPDQRDIAELVPVTRENVEEWANKWKNWLPG